MNSWTLHLPEPVIAVCTGTCIKKETSCWGMGMWEEPDGAVNTAMGCKYCFAWLFPQTLKNYKNYPSLFTQHFNTLGIKLALSSCRAP